MGNDAQPHHVAADIPAAPRGELSLRTLAMPADTNQNGDIFGGWLLSQMDIAGGIFVEKMVRLRSVTVAIEAMTFRNRCSSATWSRSTPMRRALAVRR